MYWSEVASEFSRARNKWVGRCLSPNTRLRVSRVSKVDVGPERIFGLFLHGNEIIRWYPDGTEEASLAGWDSVTTKRRLRQYSAIEIYSDVGNVWARHGNQRWPGSATTWFRTHGGDLKIPGTSLNVPTLLQVGKVGGQVPKRRDPMSNPIEGDIFETGKGEHFVAVASGYRSLFGRRYFGDLKADRRYVISTEGRIGSSLGLSGIEMLSRVGEGWKPVKRFLWKGSYTPTEGE